MRISDWSSDVCSADLTAATPAATASPNGATATTSGTGRTAGPPSSPTWCSCVPSTTTSSTGGAGTSPWTTPGSSQSPHPTEPPDEVTHPSPASLTQREGRTDHPPPHDPRPPQCATAPQTGRASGRQRLGQYVYDPGVSVT